MQTTKTNGKKNGKRFQEAIDASAAKSQAELEAAAEKRFPPKKGKQKLPVKLNEAEMRALGMKASELKDQLEKQKLAKKADNESWKAKIVGSQRELDDALIALGMGAEERNVEVVTEWIFRTNSVRTRRLDTGEVVSEREMTPEERQASLFPHDEAPKTENGKKKGKKAKDGADAKDVMSDALGKA